MGLLDGIVGGGISKIIDSGKAVLDKFIEDPDKKEQAKIAFEQEVNRHEEDMQKAQLADMDSARNREFQINNSESASWLSKNTGPIIALTIFCSFVLIHVLILLGNITAQQDEVKEIEWTLRDLCIMVVGYYFGSSSSSRKKDEHIERLSNK